MSFEDEPIDEVGDALALTVEVLEDSIADMKAATAEAVTDERFDVVDRATTRLRDLREFSQKVTDLLAEWQRTNGFGGTRRDAAEQPDSDRGAERRNYGRVGRGTKTPQPAFWRPLLEVLRDAGGSLAVADALDAIGVKMADRFTDVDHATLPSDPRQIRWRNTAQWARNDLADRGYIDRSVRGTWTITDEGRQWLESRA